MKRKIDRPALRPPLPAARAGSLRSLVGVVALFGALLVPAAHASTGTIVFQDTFATDSMLNPLHWLPMVGPDNPTGYQIYSPNEDVLDGAGLHLVSTRLTPTNVVLSGGVKTVDTFGYGQYDFVVRLPQGTGLWPSLWLEGLDSQGRMNGEIDIFEAFGSHTTWFQSTLHHWSHGAEPQPECVQVGFVIRGSICANPHLPPTDYHAAYHDYGMLWTPKQLTFFLDGKPYFTSYRNIPSQPMQLIMNVGVGGFWDGPFDATTPFPTSMDIKSVTIRALPQ